jgi:hypothetical protein
LTHSNQPITNAPKPATNPAVKIEPVAPADAVDGLVVPFAAGTADDVVVPLTSWLMKETATFEELEHLSAVRIVAVLLKVISAHCDLRQYRYSYIFMIQRTLYKALPVAPKVTTWILAF